MTNLREGSASIPDAAEGAVIGGESFHELPGFQDTSTQPLWDSGCASCRRDLRRFAGLMRSMLAEAEAQARRNDSGGTIITHDSFLRRVTQVLEEAASLCHNDPASTPFPSAPPPPQPYFSQQPPPHTHPKRLFCGPQDAPMPFPTPPMTPPSQMMHGCGHHHMPPQPYPPQPQAGHPHGIAGFDPHNPYSGLASYDSHDWDYSVHGDSWMQPPGHPAQSPPRTPPVAHGIPPTPRNTEMSQMQKSWLGPDTSSASSGGTSPRSFIPSDTNPMEDQKPTRTTITSPTSSQVNLTSECVTAAEPGSQGDDPSMVRRLFASDTEPHIRTAPPCGRIGCYNAEASNQVWDSGYDGRNRTSPSSEYASSVTAVEETVDVAKTVVQSMKDSELDRRPNQPRIHSHTGVGRHKKSKNSKNMSIQTSFLEEMNHNICTGPCEGRCSSVECRNIIVPKQCHYAREQYTNTSGMDNGNGSNETSGKYQSTLKTPIIGCRRKIDRGVGTEVLSNSTLASHVVDNSEQHRTVGTNIPSTFQMTRNQEQHSWPPIQDTGTDVPSIFGMEVQRNNLAKLEKNDTTSTHPNTCLWKGDKIMLLVPRPQQNLDQISVHKQHSETPNTDEQSYDRIEACTPFQWHVGTSATNFPHSPNPESGDQNMTSIGTQVMEDRYTSSDQPRYISSSEYDRSNADGFHRPCEKLTLCIPYENIAKLKNAQIASQAFRNTREVKRREDSLGITKGQKNVSSGSDKSLMHLINALPQPLQKTLKECLRKIPHDQRSLTGDSYKLNSSAGTLGEGMTYSFDSTRTKSMKSEYGFHSPGYSLASQRRSSVESDKKNTSGRRLDEISLSLASRSIELSDDTHDRDETENLEIILPPRKRDSDFKSVMNPPLRDLARDSEPIETIWNGHTERKTSNTSLSNVGLRDQEDDIVDREGRIDTMPAAYGTEDVHRGSQAETQSHFSIRSFEEKLLFAKHSTLPKNNERPKTKSEMSEGKKVDPEKRNKKNENLPMRMVDVESVDSTEMLKRKQNAEKSPQSDDKRNSKRNSGRSSMSARDQKGEKRKNERKVSQTVNEEGKHSTPRNSNAQKETKQHRKSIGKIDNTVESGPWNPVPEQRRHSSGILQTRTGIDHTDFKDTSPPIKPKSEESKEAIAHLSTQKAQPINLDVSLPSETADDAVSKRSRHSRKANMGSDSSERSYYSAPTEVGSALEVPDAHLQVLEYESGHKKEHAAPSKMSDTSKMEKLKSLEATEGREQDINKALKSSDKHAQRNIDEKENTFTNRTSRDDKNRKKSSAVRSSLDPKGKSSFNKRNKVETPRSNKRESKRRASGSDNKKRSLTKNKQHSDRTEDDQDKQSHSRRDQSVRRGAMENEDRSNLPLRGQRDTHHREKSAQSNPNTPKHSKRMPRANIRRPPSDSSDSAKTFLASVDLSTGKGYGSSKQRVKDSRRSDKSEKQRSMQATSSKYDNITYLSEAYLGQSSFTSKSQPRTYHKAKKYSKRRSKPEEAPQRKKSTTLSVTSIRRLQRAMKQSTETGSSKLPVVTKDSATTIESFVA